MDCLKILIDNECVNINDEFGRTAFQVAVTYGQLEVAKLLANKKVVSNIDKKGYKVLFLALYHFYY